MGRKHKKKKNDQPMSQRPVTIPELSAAHAQIANERGLIYEANQDGFTFVNSFYSSGRYVDWTDVQALSAVDGGMLIVYNNGVEETIPSSYANWSVLVRNLPDDFGWFEYLLDEGQEEEVLNFDYHRTADSENAEEQSASAATEEPSSSLSIDEASIEDMDLSEKRALLDQIKAKQEAWLGTGAEAASSISAAEEEPLIEEELFEEPGNEPVDSQQQVSESPREGNASSKESDDRLLQQILQEASGGVLPSTPTHEDGDLLTRILAEANGGNYRAATYQEAKEQLQDTRCPQNGKVVSASALGFTWEEVGGTLHKVDFGQYSDAYFDEGSNLVLEHRYGPKLTVPRKIAGWLKLLERMPFRYRSLSREELQRLIRQERANA